MPQRFELDSLGGDFDPLGNGWRDRFGLIEDRGVTTNEFTDVSHTFASHDVDTQNSPIVRVEPKHCLNLIVRFLEMTGSVRGGVTG